MTTGHRTTKKPTLRDLERHVAWSYSMGVALESDPGWCGTEGRRRRFLAHVFQETETLTQMVSRLEPLDFDPDLALDVAMILARALDLWNVAIARWRAQPECASLAAAATELAVAGAALRDGLACAPFASVGEEVARSLSVVRRVQ